MQCVCGHVREAHNYYVGDGENAPCDMPDCPCEKYVATVSDNHREVITDAFRIVESLEEGQRKDLLVLFLSNLLLTDPEKAMEYIVKIRSESRG